MAKIWAAIVSQTRITPDAPAVSGLAGRAGMSFRQLEQKVETLAAELRALDIHTLGLLCDNRPEWIIVDLAAMACGICLVPIPVFFSASQIRHLLDDAGVDCLLSESDSLPLPAGFQPVSGHQPVQGLTLYRRQIHRAAATLPPGTCKVTYTSGSTGTPKGVCLGAEQLWQVTRALVDVTTPLDITRHLCVLPLSTLLENIAGVYVPLLRGVEVCVPELSVLGFRGSSRFDPGCLLSGLVRARPGSIILTPELLNALVSAAEQGWKPPVSLVFIAVGGGRVSPALLERALQPGLPVFEGYGLSECASVVSLNRPGRNRPGSVGEPLPHVRVKIVDGEILINGSQLLGYTGDTGTSHGPWFPSGDLGYLDDDGFLYIDGRKKNLIITSFGRNVSPEWLESELNGLPGILQSAVFGDARPFCVALLYADGRVCDADLSSAITRLNDSLPDYARILAWKRLEQPFSISSATLTGNGRLRRDMIADRHRDVIEALYLHPPRPAQPPRSPIPLSTGLHRSEQP